MLNGTTQGFNYSLAKIDSMMGEEAGIVGPVWKSACKYLCIYSSLCTSNKWFSPLYKSLDCETNFMKYGLRGTCADIICLNCCYNAYDVITFSYLGGSSIRCPLTVQ